MDLSLENISRFSSPLDNVILNHFFVDEEGNLPTNEHLDQLFLFKNEPAKFLWDFEHTATNLEATSKFYKTVTYFEAIGQSSQEIKKYLFNLSIPFDHWVFIAEQPSLGFMLTWKMVIKYHHNLFLDDYQQVWDKTMNWKLEHNHGKYTFAKDLNFNWNKEGDKIQQAISEMSKRNPESK